eukprot:354246-Chlamydomonas_euryale.AAC.1
MCDCNLAQLGDCNLAQLGQDLACGLANIFVLGPHAVHGPLGKRRASRCLGKPRQRRRFGFAASRGSSHVAAPTLRRAPDRGMAWRRGGGCNAASMCRFRQKRRTPAGDGSDASISSRASAVARAPLVLPTSPASSASLGGAPTTPPS